MIKEIPILFSTMMVQAILDDRKTMTRRTKGLEFINKDFGAWEYLGVDALGHLMRNEYGATNAVKCPYGKPGDLLWVRENIYQEGELGLEYVADKELILEEIIPEDYGPYGGSYSFRTIPNIHMPKWAARIWLEVTDVRVERLQDISEDDAEKEGVESYDSKKYWKDYEVESAGTSQFIYKAGYTAKRSFQSLWQLINGRESWNANPWIWVVSFKVLSKTGKSTLDAKKHQELYI